MSNNLNTVLLGDEQDIDDHILKLIKVILKLKNDLDTIIQWHNNEWLNIVNEKKKNYIESSKQWDKYESWIYKYIYEPKRYEFCVYLRSFLNTLKIYLKKDHRDHIKCKNFWESSKYLKYLIHLIFKTGFYKVENDNKEWEYIIIEKDNEIIEELEALISFISKPLHAFSIYYNTNKKLNDENVSNAYLNKKITSISTLILERSVLNENVIKHEINPEKKGNEQEYLKWTSSITMDCNSIYNFLKFIESNCLREFEEYIEFKRKFKAKNV